MHTVYYNTYNLYKAICIQYIVRTEYKANSIGGLTTVAGMVEPQSPPPEEQGIPGSILDEAPFFSIGDFQRFLDKAPFFSIGDFQRFLSGFERLVLKLVRLGRHCNMDAPTPSPTHHAINIMHPI